MVGLDNFNDYYSVQLKLNRAALLSREGVKVYRGDLCDGTLLRSLFDKYDFTHVLHLAGRTGVRASLKDPAAYAATNIGCFLSLLDVIKDRKVRERSGCVYLISMGVSFKKKITFFRIQVLSSPRLPVCMGRVPRCLSLHTHLLTLPATCMRLQNCWPSDLQKRTVHCMGYLSLVYDCLLSMARGEDLIWLYMTSLIGL